MVICFESLVNIGVLMVSELDSTLICRPGFSYQESANHQGLDVKHFECFRIVVPPATRCLGLHVPRMSPQKPSKKSRLLKSRYLFSHCIFHIDLGTPVDFSWPLFYYLFLRFSPNSPYKLGHRHLFHGILQMQS